MSGELNVRRIDWAAVIIRSCKATAPTCRPKLDIVNGVAAVLADVFEHYAVNSRRRVCHFISQSIIECDYYQTLTEYASGDAYDQRTDMGFTAAKDGDGRINKGFGIFQNTGPNNQRAALKALLALGFPVTQDVSNARSVLTVPKYAAWGAGIYWGQNRLNAVADRDSTGALMSRAINRGNANSKKPANHEADRIRAFKATWKELENPRLIALAGGPDQVNTAVAHMASAGASPDLKPWDGHTPPKLMPGIEGEPINRAGMSPEEVARLDAGAREMAEALSRGDDMTPVLGESYKGSAPLNQGIPAAGMDAEEHEDQVAAGETPDAGPSSPNTPLPAEPVAPGHPEALIKASQERLRAKGFYGVGTPDGDPGWKTVQATAGFQAVAGLPVTGQLDKATMDAIWSEDAPDAPVSAERALTTVSDLRGKSKIVDEAERVKTASLWQIGLGAVTAGGTAVVTGFSSAWASLGEVREAFADAPGWVWGVAAFAITAGPAAYAYWKSHKVQVARVDDQATGKTA